MNQPALETGRLILRQLSVQDLPAIHRMACRREIADTTLAIPHPYSEEMARNWIGAQADAFAQGESMVFAIESKAATAVVGTIGFKEIGKEHAQAEMGFWIGVEYWRNDFATEAARELVRYGFTPLEL